MHGLLPSMRVRVRVTWLIRGGPPSSSHYGVPGGRKDDTRVYDRAGGYLSYRLKGSSWGLGVPLMA